MCKHQHQPHSILFKKNGVLPITWKLKLQSTKNTLGPHNLFNTATIYWSVFVPKQENEWSCIFVIRVFYDISIGFSNCSDNVVFLFILLLHWLHISECRDADGKCRYNGETMPYIIDGRRMENCKCIARAPSTTGYSCSCKQQYFDSTCYKSYIIRLNLPLSLKRDWYTIIQLNSVTMLCLSQAQTYWSTCPLRHFFVFLEDWALTKQWVV